MKKILMAMMLAGALAAGAAELDLHALLQPVPT
jgi:hypothetical protein